MLFKTTSRIHRICSVLFVALLCASCAHKAKDGRLEIAYVGLKNSEYDKFCFEVFKHLIEAIEIRDSIDIHIEYFAFEKLQGDSVNKEEIRHFYEHIQSYNRLDKAQNFDLIVDNTWGKHLAETNKYLLKHNLPIFILNGSHNFKKFPRSSVFLNSDDYSIRSSCAIISSILDADSVIIFSEKDFNRNLRQELQDFGIEEFSSFYDVPNGNDSVQTASLFTLNHVSDTIRARISKLSSQDRSIPILLNVHTDAGKIILDQIQNEFQGLTLICPIFSTSTLKEGEFFNISNSNRIFGIQESISSFSDSTINLYLHYKNDILKGNDLLSNPAFFSRLRDLSTIIAKSCQRIKGNNKSLNASSFLDELQEFDELVSSLKGELSNSHFQHPFTCDTNDVALELDQWQVFQKIDISTIGNNQIQSYPYQIDENFDVIPSVSVTLDLKNVVGIDFQNSSYEILFDAEMIIPDTILLALESDSLKKTGGGFKSVGDFITVWDKYEQPLTLNSANYHNDELRAQVLRESYRVKVSNDFVTSDYPFDQHILQLKFQLTNLLLKSKMYIHLPHLSGSRYNLWPSDAFSNSWYLKNSSINRKLESKALGNYISVDDEFDILILRQEIHRKSTNVFFALILPFFLLSACSILLIGFASRRIANTAVISSSVLFAVFASAIPLYLLKPTSIITTADWYYLINLLTVLFAFLCHLIFPLIRSRLLLAYFKWISIWMISIIYLVSCFILLSRI